MIDVNSWGWPQWLVMATFMVAIILSAHLHGKPKSENYSFWRVFIVRIIWAGVLMAGGFFS